MVCGEVRPEIKMISNLPLLFADGQPTCLEKITVSQLEKFVPFMIQCSCGQSDLRKLIAPPWWPTGLPFIFPLLKPIGSESKWSEMLKNLVYRCYSYHDCDFMLRFCADLSQLSTSHLKYVDSWDGTTSLYNKVTGKLLVTFRNENLCYDRKKNSPKKTLLHKNNGESIDREAMVQPPPYDVYLCDNCDEEFNTLKEVQDHENSCCGKQHETRGPTPPCTEEYSKESFLGYFKLVDSKNNNSGKSENSPLRKRGFRNSLRYSSIPISSPLGRLVYKKTKASSTTSAVQLDRLERYCPAKPSVVNVENCAGGSTIWPVSWKPRKKGEDNNWVHVYRKPGRQWRKKKTVVQKKLCDKNKKLLSQCQNLQVHVRKLTAHEIAFYTNSSSGTRRSVDSIVEEPKCVMPLSSGCSTNSVHLPTVKSNSDSEMKNSKKTNVQVQNLNEFNSIKITKRVDRSKSLCNDITIKRKQTNSVEVTVSQKDTKKQIPLSSLYPQITCEYKALDAVKLVSNSSSCELTCIPVIDLVSSDEECEKI